MELLCWLFPNILNLSIRFGVVSMGEILKAYFVPHPPIIIPDIGKGEESAVSSTIDAYHEVAKQVKDLSPDVIILTTPHGPAYSDYIHISPGPALKAPLKTLELQKLNLISKLKQA